MYTSVGYRKGSRQKHFRVSYVLTGARDKEEFSSSEIVMRSSASGKTRQSMGVLLLCLLLMVPGSATYSRAGYESKTLTEEERIVHVLNRLGFGPRTGDIEKVAAIGLIAYIEQQINPR